MNRLLGYMAVTVWSIAFVLWCALQLPEPKAVQTTEVDMAAAVLAHYRYYYSVRDSTRALVRRRYKGDKNSPEAQAYFRHMDSAYDPVYLK